MYFGFDLELSNADLLNIDLLDTHLYLLYTVSILISPVSILLQDMSSTRLQRKKFSSSKTSRKIVTLKTC